MTATRFEQAIDGLATFFVNRQTRPGVVARRLLDIPHADDDRLVDQLIRERRRRTRLDGSVDGSLYETARAASELLQLGCTKGHAGLDRMIGFLLARQDRPGRFGEGCSERRHEVAHCKHFMSGFFSPGSRDEAIAPLALPTQVVIVTEFGARFAVSCFALRTVLRAGEERREPVRRHLESLLQLAHRWQSQGEFPGSMDVVCSAMSALSLAPPEYRERVDAVADRLIGMQSADGSWPDTTLFHALDGILYLQTDTARSAIARAVPYLLSLQRPQGTFDESDSEELALIALRALRTQRAGRGTPRRQRRAQSATPSGRAP